MQRSLPTLQHKTSQPAPLPVALAEALSASLGRLERHALALCKGDQSLAEDLLQDTLIKLCERPPEWQGAVPLHRWLRTVMRRLWIDRWRQQQAEGGWTELSLDAILGWESD